MATFAFVPGAWIGGWAFADVTRRLRQRGHDVYPLTLTGLGERSHLIGPAVDLDTHITDVVNVLAYEDLHDVVLVGHSYAGIVVTGVVDRAGDRLAQLVYLDTAPLADGQSMLDFEGPEGAEQLRRQVQTRGDGFRLAYPGFEQLGPPPMLEGLGAAERALLEARATAHPFGTYTQPLRLSAPRDARYRRVVVACNGFRFIEQVLPAAAAFLTPAWIRHDLDTGHWPMLSAPAALADLLASLAT